MTQQAHDKRAHALLGASKASQWINCPPSARLQESIPDTRSEFANEGTLAHEFSENKLRRRLGAISATEKVSLLNSLEQIKSSQYYGQEMEDAITEYVELVDTRYIEATTRSSDAVILLEESLDFSEWVPDGYGTGDVVLISDGVLEVVDLKYGKGVPVSAIGNPQIRLYALGAWSTYNYLYAINEVRMTIIQPRLDSVSTDTMAMEDLIEWAETVVRPAAKLAFAGEGEFKPGDHCRWCKVKATCRARADANMLVIQHEFKEPSLLTDDEIGAILSVAEELAKWAKDVQEYAFERAKSGHRIPLWKLVEGRSNRSITDKDAAKQAFESARIETDKYLKPQELLGIGDLEKRIGKKELAVLLDGLIVKPQGRPTLVPETDKRPELNSVDSDFASEEFEVS